MEKKYQKFVNEKELEEKKKRERDEIEKNQREEQAFLESENNEIERENNEQLKTKRIIDKMVASTPNRMMNEMCELLANYKGILQMYFATYIFLIFFFY